ncbi:MAG: hypothetical protein RML93_01955 [Anaerolineales bacterium]|nr:hypothetical protein [Anaerolineales bacterium]MCS7248788.1 hypothetical protein [Anaerolineales bacterium]MDW8162601.1 hypothetical protein [Anaerolineales bacterium]MDW8446037.1 hypothetical protein [Anaerolineales bacterium]
MIDGYSLLIFLGLSLLLVVSTLVQRKVPYTLREIPGFQRLRRAIGLAVEDGKRIHISLGRGVLLSENFGVTLSGLGVLKLLSRFALISDHPPIATTGEGSLMLLAQDGLRSTYNRLGLAPRNLPQQAVLAGTTPLAYGVGAYLETREGRIAVDLLIGHLGNEAAWLGEASHRQGNLSIAGSDHLTAQAVFTAVATYALIGEEVFAAGAYLDSNTAQRASLQTQDIARWAIVVFLILASGAKLLGI